MAASTSATNDDEENRNRNSDLVRYLRHGKTELSGGRASSYDNIRVVIGNESGDMDSTVCAIVHGYAMSIVPHYDRVNFRVTEADETTDLTPHIDTTCPEGACETKDYASQSEAVKASSPTIASERILYISVLNYPCEDFKLRKDIKWVLSEAGIDESMLIFRDEIDLNTLAMSSSETPASRFQLTLVDHNILSEMDRDLDRFVVEVIDHHRREKDRPFPTTVETVGSCATLIAEKLFAAGDRCNHMVDATVARIIYAAILLDTTNFSDAKGTARPKDVSITSELEQIIFNSGSQGSCIAGSISAENVPRSNNNLSASEKKHFLARRCDFFQTLQRLRSSVDGLTSGDLLRKDRKTVHDWDICSLPMPVAAFLRRDDDPATHIVQHTGKFGRLGVIVMGLGEKQTRREVGVWSNNVALRDKLVGELKVLNEAHFVQVPCDCPGVSFFEVDRKTTRKFLLPMVQDILDSWTLC